MDLLNLNSFLRFSYFLKFKNPDYRFDMSGIDRGRFNRIDEEALIDRGIKLWIEAIEKNFVTNKKHLVPISGGLDSRAILAALLRFTEAENITTYTFGTPGTLDYDIGNRIASAAGTKHWRFDLTENRYTIEELLDVSKRIHHQTVLFHHPPIWKIDELFPDFVVWSGFAGGPVSGSHFPARPSTDPDEAKLSFIKKETFVKSVLLSNSSESDFSNIIDFKGLDRNIMTYEEQIDFENRQLKYIAPHLLMDGFEYKTPFLYPPFFNFMLGIPNRYRHGRYLYKKMLFRLSPELFKIETKSLMGLAVNTTRWRIQIRRIRFGIRRRVNRIKPIFFDPNINFVDFDDTIREEPSLRKVIHDNVMDLKKRNIIDWIDIESIWKSHINKRANHADALLVLASLEIHLKAGKRL